MKLKLFLLKWKGVLIGGRFFKDTSCQNTLLDYALSATICHSVPSIHVFDLCSTFLETYFRLHNGRYMLWFQSMCHSTDVAVGPYYGGSKCYFV